jgi:hypothetical protein
MSSLIIENMRYATFFFEGGGEREQRPEKYLVTSQLNESDDFKGRLFAKELWQETKS